MDVFISKEEPILNAQTRPSFFEPLRPVRTTTTFATSSSLVSFNDVSSATTQTAASPIPTNPNIDVHLIISDPTSDNSLTPGWTVPIEPLSLPASTTIPGFIDILRDHLPKRDFRLKSRSAGFTKAITGHDDNGYSSPNNKSMNINSPPWRSSSPCRSLSPRSASPSRISTSRRFRLHSFRRDPRPRLDYARMYLLAGDGEIVPICRNDAEWHFKDGIAKCDLVGRSEEDWRRLKDLLVAAGRGLKCYVAIKAVDLISKSGNVLDF